MSADYVPRHGDRIKVEMTVVPTGKQDTQNAALADWLVAQLAAEGKVELVARAEPDWQPGDIGQHIETGELYRYFPDAIGMSHNYPWWPCDAASTSGDPASREVLAGKLRRMHLVPEGDDAPAAINQHAHICEPGNDQAGVNHAWPCANGHHLSGTYGRYLGCPDHA